MNSVFTLRIRVPICFRPSAFRLRRSMERICRPLPCAGDDGFRLLPLRMPSSAPLCLVCCLRSPLFSLFPPFLLGLRQPLGPPIGHFSVPPPFGVCSVLPVCPVGVAEMGGKE